VRKDSAGRSDQSADDAYGLATLTPAERMICGPLIRRQFHRNPRIEEDLDKNGLPAMARLCSARALFSIDFLLGMAGITLVISGIGGAASIFVLLFVLVGALVVIRGMSATRAGKRWRSEHPSPSGRGSI
jgi:hypothetical protein